MPLVTNGIIQDRLKTLSKTFAIILGTIGILVIVGWLFDISLFKSVLPGFIAMKFNVSVCFVLASISLLLLNKSKPAKSQKIIVFIFLLLIFLVSILSLVEYYFPSINFGIDEFLIKGEVIPYENSPGQMPPIPAATLTLTAIIMFVRLYNPKNYKLPQTLSLIILVISIFSSIGFLFNIENFYGFFYHKPMAIHAAFGFIMLSFSLLTSQGNKGIIQLFTITSNIGILTRKILPILLVIEILLGWIHLFGDKYKLYSEGYGIALFCLINGVIISFILIIVTRKLKIYE